MTTWARAGRTAASPSRLALSRHRFAACGLDPPGGGPADGPQAIKVRIERNRSFHHRFAGRGRALPDRERPFVWEPSGAMLAGCPDSASASALCPMIFTSFLARGRGSGDRSSTTLRHGQSPTNGPTPCRSLTPNSTCSRHGSATCSTSFSDRADDLTRRHLP
jgi:hypothetical protein